MSVMKGICRPAMTDVNFEQALAAANAPLANGDRNRQVGPGEPRFELYHFALSLCSQKVRACLDEKAACYVAHDINLQMPLLGNYDPAYVRLRLMGAPDRPLATQYTGRSSVETEGFDPAVVPTLADLNAQRVIVDSMAICRYVDRQIGTGPPLVPEPLAASVAEEIGIVDCTPHVALLYGAHPDGDFRPRRLRDNMPGVHDRKIDKISKARARVADDPRLAAAFDAKTSKEEAARNFVATDESMRQAVSETVAIVAALEYRLDSDRPFLCGDSYTMADLFWAVSLFRLEWLGASFCWTGGHRLNDTPRPLVEAYATRLFARPSFQSAIIHWPDMPRSEFVSHHYAARD